MSINFKFISIEILNIVIVCRFLLLQFYDNDNNKYSIYSVRLKCINVVNVFFIKWNSDVEIVKF